VRATKGAQVVVQWNGEWGRGIFVSTCFMWWNWPLFALFIFSIQMLKLFQYFCDTCIICSEFV
jgi:hypothetical protein